MTGVAVSHMGVGTSAPPGLRGLAWATITTASFSMLTPIFNGGDPPVKAGLIVVGLTMSMVLPIAWGAISADSRFAQGVVGGAALYTAGLYLFLLSFSVLFKGFLGDSVNYGPAFGFQLATVLFSTLTFLVSLQGGSSVGEPRTTGGMRAFGVIAAAVLVWGIMLPAPDSFVTFKQQNFEFGDGFVQFSYVVLMATIFLAGWIGFSSGTRWGIGLVVGSLVPVSWLMINSLMELTRPNGEQIGVSGVLRTDIHPVFIVMLVVMALSVLVAKSQLWSVSNPVNSGGSQSSPPSRPRQEPVSDAPTSEPQAWVAPLVAEEVSPLMPSDVQDPAEHEFEIRSMHDVDSGHTTMPDSHEVDLDETVSAPLGPIVTFPDGKQRVLNGTMVIGRDPEALESDQYAQLVALGEDDKRISRTHLAIGTSANQSIWVEDRNSANGVMIEEPGCTCRVLTPGEPLAVRDGTTVLFGATTLLLRKASSN